MYKPIIIFIVILLMFSSCSEDKIQLSPISQESSGNFYKTPEQIEQAVVGVYDGLQLSGQYREYFIYLMEVRSDNSYQQSTSNRGGVLGDVDLFRMETNSNVVDLTWEDCYEGIQRCNIVLNRIESVPNNPNMTIQIGETKFIRALTYFNLVRLFGDVPLVTKEYDDPFEAFNLGRTPKAEVYDQIIKDLTEVSQSLSTTALRPGGATKNAAYALLGKVQLTLGNTSEAITALRNVSGKLLTNYADNFGIANENSEESLFEVQFKKGGIGEGSPYANLFTPFGATYLIGGIGTASGDNLPTQDLFNSYQVGDLRRDVTIGKTTSGVLYTKKYLGTPFKDKDGENNFIVLRYADVVLMLAEALNEQGYVADGEAFTLLNTIRNRAGLSSLTASELANQNNFRLAIANERRWELAFENHRWFDLVRTGKAIEVMNAHTSESGKLNTVTNEKLIYPIPQSQVDATNGKIAPNPGY
jgi:starch-binding outer membrane protein, SusD/RagB family